MSTDDLLMLADLIEQGGELHPNAELAELLRRAIDDVRRVDAMDDANPGVVDFGSGGPITEGWKMRVALRWEVTVPQDVARGAETPPSVRSVREFVDLFLIQWPLRTRIPTPGEALLETMRRIAPETVAGGPPPGAELIRQSGGPVDVVGSWREPFSAPRAGVPPPGPGATPSPPPPTSPAPGPTAGPAPPGRSPA